jgi:zinc/manganese transport system substrate-binding protein
VLESSPRLLCSVALLALLIAGCGNSGSSSSTSGNSGKLRVVAAENFWGSLAQQLGGERVQVTSIVANPTTDPHSYEPTSNDARTLAGSKMVIVNGIGYDQWAPKLLAANPDSSRLVLTVGDLLGLKDGDNPHQWYSPSSVERVVNQITTEYKKLDPKRAGFYDRQKAMVESKNLAQYKQLITGIKSRYSGVPVGTSESIFAPMADALGLKLLTPPGFLKAISEGTDPTASDKATTDRQIKDRQIKVWVYNSQNSTPDVQRLTDEARKQGIPVTTITETLTPATATFEAWQLAQLKALAAALARATGR